MAVKVEAFRLSGRVEIDGKRARTELRDTERDAKAVASSFKGLRGEVGSLTGALGGRGGFLPGLANISNIIQGLPQIGNLAHALISPLKDAAEEGIRFNMLIEEAEIGFEGVTGGAKQASRYVQELTDFAAKNPIFNTQGTVNAARQMSIFGFETRKTTNYLKIWGGALAQGGQFSDENLQGVVRAFGQIRSLGRVTSEDINMLQDRGIPAWELLAKAIGKTVAETRKLGEQGKLRGAPAVDAITAMLETDPRFAGGADKFAKSVKGRLAQLQDLREVAAGKAMSGTTKELGATLEAAMTGDIPQLVDKMAAGFDAALTPVAKIISASVKGTLGGGITSGLAEGIEAGKSMVTKTVGDFALNAVISPFKSMLGINSPSKVFAEYGGNVADGFENGLVDRTSRGFGRWAKALEKAGGDAFVKGVEGIARRLGVDPAFIMNMLAAESQFNPRAKNPLPGQSAAGLFQATNQTARGLGYANSEQLRRASVAEQLNALARYLKQRGVKPGATQEQVYGAVGYGSSLDNPNRVLFRRGETRYRLNAPAWDVNRDGMIKYGELGQYARNKGGFSSTGFTVNAAPVSASNPVPVTVISGHSGGGAGEPYVVSGASVSGATGGGFNQAAAPFVFRQQAQLSTTLANVLKETLPIITPPLQELPIHIQNVNAMLGFTPDVVREMTASVRGAEVAAGSFADSVLGSVNKMDAVMQSFGQIAGMMPQQQVGKKRGFFSKLLGFAAPFLSFIPGVGPILSAAASIGSSALAGDWGGALTGAAGAFSSGGAFRSSGGSGGGSIAPVSTTNTPIITDPAALNLPRRALGGPVRRGRAYLVGEERAEVFMPDEDGYIHPDAAAFRRAGAGARGQMSSGGGGIFERLAQAIEHLRSMPPEHVVMAGARTSGGARAIADGYMSHASRDPRAVEWQQRRMSNQ